MLFSLQPRTFATEAAKVAFVITHLCGRARLWGTAEWEHQTGACASFQAFAKEILKVFYLSCSRSSSAALVDAFLHHLADYMKDALVAYDMPQTLDGVIELATRVDLCVQIRRRERHQETQAPETHP